METVDQTYNDIPACCNFTVLSVPGSCVTDLPQGLSCFYEDAVLTTGLKKT